MRQEGVVAVRVSSTLVPGQGGVRPGSASQDRVREQDRSFMVLDTDPGTKVDTVRPGLVGEAREEFLRSHAQDQLMVEIRSSVSNPADAILTLSPREPDPMATVVPDQSISLAALDSAGAFCGDN